MFDFPNAPTVGQVATTPAGATFTWDGTKWVSGGATTVSIAAGTGITASPNPITGSGTLSLTVPVSVANGGTGSTTAAGAPWVEVAGDSMTGNLEISHGSWPTLMLRKPSPGVSCQLASGTGANTRWVLQIGDSSAESGSNLGSDFVLSNYSDGGSLLGSALSISRATGLLTGSSSTWSGTVQANSAVFTRGAGALPTQPGGTDSIVRIAGSSGGFAAAMLFDAWSTGSNGGMVNFRMGRGTPASTTALQSGDAMGTIQAFGHDGSAYFMGIAQFWATQQVWNGTSHGSRITTYMTPDNSSTIAPANIQFGNGDYQIYGSNAWKPGGGQWVAPSDLRLKTDVAPYETGLAALLEIQPVTYRYNGLGGMPTEGTFHGIVADDVAMVLPEAVGKVGLPDDISDARSSVTEFMSFDATPLLYVLVNAAKELSAKVDALTARIAALEGAA